MNSVCFLYKAKTTQLIFLMLLVGVLFFGCKKDDNNPGPKLTEYKCVVTTEADLLNIQLLVTDTVPPYDSVLFNHEVYDVPSGWSFNWFQDGRKMINISVLLSWNSKYYDQVFDNTFNMPIWIRLYRNGQLIEELRNDDFKARVYIGNIY